MRWFADKSRYVPVWRRQSSSARPKHRRTLLGVEPLERRTVLAPVILSVSDDKGFEGDRVTSDNTLLIHGRAQPGAPVTLSRDGQLLGRTSANAAGAWTFDNTRSILPDGDHVFVALAGTEQSNPLHVWVRTATPQVVEGGHHDPNVPNFAHELNAAGRRIRISQATGRWSEQFANAAVNDVIVLRHPVVAAGNIDVHSVVIEAGGKLSFAPGEHSQLRVVNLQVLEGGGLEIGTVDNPITGSVEVMFKDAPLDLAHDPQQYGNGLLGLGQVRMHGRLMGETFVRLAAEARIGERTLSLAAPMADWRVGDRLVLPDSRQGLFGEGLLNRQDETFGIAAISADGLRITLDSPLRFHHRGAHGSSPGLDLMPYVGNISRNVTLRSENPSGTRAHVQIFDRADLDVRFAAFSNLGRTKNKALDSTTRDASGNVTHVGTNQIGRYALHLHHVTGPRESTTGYQFIVEGNSFTSSTKWAIALHDSHYGLIKQNVVYGAAGAGIVTEDGSESYNRLEENFVARVNGDRGRGKFRSGTEGDGFWLAGPNNTLVGNVAASVASAGYRVYGGENSGPVFVEFPLEPSEAPHHHGVLVNLAEVPLAQFANNEVYTAMMGIELWYLGFKDYYEPIDGEMRESVILNQRVWHTHRLAIFGDQQNHLTIDGLVALGDPAFMRPMDFPEGIHLRASQDVVVRNSHVENFKIGLTAPQKSERFTTNDASPGPIHPTLVQDSTFRNFLDVLVTPLDFDSAGALGAGALLLDNVVLAGQTTVSMHYDASPDVGLNIVRPFRVLVRSHNGVPGADYELFWREQSPQFIVPATDRLAGLTAAPHWMTNQQLWREYGIAVFGQVLPAGAVPGTNLRIDGYVLPLSESTRPAPQLAMGGTTGYGLNSQEIVLAPRATVAADRLHFGGGQLRVSIVEGADWSNRLGIGGAFRLVGNDVMLGSRTIGSIISSGVGQRDLAIAFTTSATPKDVEQLVRSITFRTRFGISTTSRLVSFTLIGPDGALSPVRSKLVTVRP